MFPSILIGFIQINQHVTNNITQVFQLSKYFIQKFTSRKVGFKNMK